MSREYSENVLIQNSAGNLLQNVLGWKVVLAYNSEKLGPDGTLGRTSWTRCRRNSRRTFPPHP